MTDIIALINNMRDSETRYVFGQAAADALEVQAEQIKYLRQIITDLEKRQRELLEDKLTLWRHVKELKARIAALEAALKPFADAIEGSHENDEGDIWESGAATVISFADLRAARAALEGKDV